MRSSMNPWLAAKRKPEDSKMPDVLGGLLVLLMLLIPAMLIGLCLHRLTTNPWGMSFTNVDPMLFRIAGLG